MGDEIRGQRVDKKFAIAVRERPVLIDL